MEIVILIFVLRLAPLIIMDMITLVYVFKFAQQEFLLILKQKDVNASVLLGYMPTLQLHYAFLIAHLEHWLINQLSLVLQVALMVI